MEPKKKILLVEDELITALATKFQLEKFGYTVIHSRTGESAVDFALGNFSIDLVLMDIDLGAGIDGTQAAKIILESIHIPIIFLTSHAEEEYVKKVKQITRYGYVVKDSNEFVLRSSIEMAFELFEIYSQLNKSQERYKTLFNTMNEGIAINQLVVNEQGDGIDYIIIDANPAFEKQSHLKIKEVLNQPASKIYKLSTEYVKAWWSAHRTKTTAVQSEYFDPSNQRWFNVIITPFENGQFSTIFTDITHAKNSLDSLRQNEETFFTSFEQAPVGILIKSITDGTILHSNEMVSTITGFSKAELIGKSCTSLGWDKQANGMTDFINNIKNYKVYSYKNTFKRKNNQEVHCLIAGTEINLLGQVRLLVTLQDITKFELHERSALHPNQMLNALLQSSPFYTSILDQRGTVLFENRTHPLNIHPIKTAHTIFDFVEPHDINRVKENLQLSFESGTTQHYEWCTTITEDQCARWFDVWLSPVFVNGKVINVKQIIHEITEKKIKTNSLSNVNAPETQPALWSDFVFDAIITTDIHLNITGWNKAATSIYGWSNQEALGENIDLLLKTRFLSVSHKEALHALYEKGVWMGLIEQVTRTGKRLYMECSVTFIRDKENVIIGGIAVNRDVTEREITRTRLSESEQRFTSAFENAPIGMALNSPDGSWLKVNHALCTITGYSQEELLATSFQAITHPDDLIKNLELYKKTLSGEINGYQMEKRYFHKDGHILWIDASITLVRFENGEPNYFISQLTDITKRKIAEDNFKYLLNEKEIILQEVHHRVKNNMNTMASLLALQSASINNEDVTYILKDAIGRIKSMSILYNKLYNTENIYGASSKSYLSDLIDEVTNLFIGNTITVEKFLDDFILTPKKLSSIGIITNELMTNGMKHAFPNGNNGSIKISLIKDTSHASLIYEDDGVGIHTTLRSPNDSFGMTLINLLTSQVNGILKIKEVKGTFIEISFPL